MTKNKLYLIVSLACFAGFLYLIYHSESSSYSLCIFKNVTSYPCPSCGTTRAIEFLIKGDLIRSLAMNPFGMIVFCIMVVSPLWIGYDIVSKKETFFTFYTKIENIVKTKKIAIILIALVLLNWIWNLKKGL